jgi:hypothetical protein
MDLLCIFKILFWSSKFNFERFDRNLRPNWKKIDQNEKDVKQG